MNLRMMAALFLLSLFALPAPAQETLRRVRIAAEDAPALAAALEARGWDVLEGSVERGSLELITSVAEVAELEQLGYAPEVLAVGQPFAAIQAADGGTTGYPDLAQIYADMAAHAAAYPALAKVVDLTATSGAPPTVEGRHILALKVSDNVQLDEDEPRFLVVSCYHARELVTPVIALTLIDRWLTLYGSSPGATAAVDGHELWVVPVWNPDGYAYVFEVDNFWRKNRRVFADGIGVDLNRNYPLGWDGPCAGSTSAWSETYKGPSAASEAETATLLAFASERHFAKVIDLHSYGQEVLWGYLCLAHPFAGYLQSEATALSIAAGYGGAERPPSADGEHYEWDLAHQGTHAFLIETATDFQPPYAAAQLEALQVLGAINWMAQRPIPITGRVTDACTGAPLVADVKLVGVTFSNGETNASAAPFGRYHVFVPAGAWTLEFSRAGYASEQHVVNVSPGSSTTLDVTLAALATAAVSGPLQPGTELALDIDAPADAGRFYVAAAGLSGTAPGIPIGGCTLPLNPDFLAFLSAASNPPFSGFNGFLDGTGHATATLHLPADPLLVGLALDLAFLTLNATSGALLHPSNAAHAVIVP